MPEKKAAVSERFAMSPEKTKLQDDEPDVEGHRYRHGPVEGESLNPDADEPAEGEEGLRAK